METHPKQQDTSVVRALVRFSMFSVFFFIFFTSILTVAGVFKYAEAETEDKNVEIVSEEETEKKDVSDENTDDEQVEEDTSSTSQKSKKLVESTERDPRIPTNISAPVVELEKSIVNPRSRDVEALNEALRRGVTYYPGSGYLGQDSNIFLFGHSSRLPVVNNEHYRSFNRLNELEPGDPIYLSSGDTRYTYRVTRSYEAKDHEIIVDFKSDKPRLTLTTCNVFGEREDRYIVEAVLAKKEEMR